MLLFVVIAAGSSALLVPDGQNPSTPLQAIPVPEVAAAPMPPPPAPAPVPVLTTLPIPARAVPPPSRAVPKQAKPKNNPVSWATDADYPKEFKNGESGTTGFRLTIGLDGRPIACVITLSSGYPRFDELTCSMLIRRARFHPATDAEGKPVRGTWSSRVRWKRPIYTPPPPVPPG